MAKIKVSVERIDGSCTLPMQVGDHFYVEDSRLTIPDGKYVCIWALQSMMPIFPIYAHKDRLEEGHWIKKVKNFSCPDPDGLTVPELLHSFTYISPLFSLFVSVHFLAIY